MEKGDSFGLLLSSIRNSNRVFSNFDLVVDNFTDADNIEVYKALLSNRMNKSINMKIVEDTSSIMHTLSLIHI